MAADNEPTPINSNINIEPATDEPSSSGEPAAEAQNEEAPAPAPVVTLRDEIYDFAQIIADLAKHPKQGGYGINPAVGIQIIATVLQNNISQKQLGMYGMPPLPADEPTDGDTDD